VKGYRAIERLQTELLQPLASQSQLDLVQDIFQWVTGEYGMAILPPKLNAPLGQSLDWVFAVNRSTSPEIQTGIAKLDQIARDRGLTIGPIQLGFQVVQAWTKLSSQGRLQNLQAEGVAAHTTIGNYEIFSTSLATLGEIMNQSEKTLVKSTIWNAVTQDIPTPNAGYLYLDWNAVQPIAKRKLPGFQLIEILAQPMLRHVDSLTASSTKPAGEISKGTIVVGLK